MRISNVLYVLSILILNQCSSSSQRNPSAVVEDEPVASVDNNDIFRRDPLQSTEDEQKKDVTSIAEYESKSSAKWQPYMQLGPLKQSKLWTLGDVNEYFQKSQPGLFHLNQSTVQKSMSPALRYFRYLAEHRAFVPSVPDPDGHTQDFFSFDAKAFIAQEKAEDFIRAKENHYSRLFFDTKVQRYRRPSNNISTWTALVHPPIKTLQLPLKDYVKEFDSGAPLNEAYYSVGFQRYLDRISGSSLTFQNQLKLLPNHHAYKEKIRLIRGTQKKLWVAVMAVICDDSTQVLVDEMIKKRKEGADIKIMVDGFFKFMDLGCINKMRAGGLDVVTVKTSFGVRTATQMFHHKFWVRDNEEVIVGGMNLLYVDNLSTGFNGMNRDTDVLVHGPAVTDFAQSWVELWRRHRDPDLNADISASVLEEIKQKIKNEHATQLRGQDQYVGQLSAQARKNGICRVLVQEGNAINHAIAPVLQNYAERAQRHIVFTSPELSYGKEKDVLKHRIGRLMHAMMMAAQKRSVRVDVISNGVEGGFGELSHIVTDVTDYINQKGFLAQKLSDGLIHIRDEVDKNMSRNNRVRYVSFKKYPGMVGWTYMGYMHAKQYLFDETAAFVGSFNIEKHSGDTNPESGIVCLDAGLVKQLREQLTLDLINSVPALSVNQQ